jgi:microcystin-dependent protein
MEGALGEIRLFAGLANGKAFVPRGWMLCDGKILNIQQNIPLFAIVGAIYGGDGIRTFALPDLRGRLPVGIGAGPGLPPYELAKTAGSEQIPTQPTSVTTDDLVGDVNSVVPGAINNVQPVLALNYIICVEGSFPTKPDR